MIDNWDRNQTSGLSSRRFHKDLVIFQALRTELVETGHPHFSSKIFATLEIIASRVKIPFGRRPGVLLMGKILGPCP